MGAVAGVESDYMGGMVMSATVFNSTKSTVTVLNALKTKLEAVQWTPTGGSATAVFQKVGIFDLTDIVPALNELFAFGERVCFVILEGEDFREEKVGQEMRYHQQRRVSLIFSDRNWGDRQLALLGDTTTTPGALVLKDLLMPGVTGILVDGVYAAPESGELIELHDQARQDAPGRIVYRQPFVLTGGMLAFHLGKKPLT